jgi:biopolymer transport protein ExbD
MNFRPAGRRKSWLSTTVDITPLVDVIFQLLIFFFYTANFIQNPHIPVKLTKASSAVSSSSKQSLVVTLTKQGDIVLDGQKLDLKGLRAHLSKVAKDKPETQLMIRPDNDAQAGKLITIINTARDAGLSRVGVVTRSAGVRRPGPGTTPSPPAMGP